MASTHEDVPVTIRVQAEADPLSGLWWATVRLDCPTSRSLDAVPGVVAHLVAADVDGDLAGLAEVLKGQSEPLVGLGRALATASRLPDLWPRRPARVLMPVAVTPACGSVARTAVAHGLFAMGAWSRDVAIIAPADGAVGEMLIELGVERLTDALVGAHCGTDPVVDRIEEHVPVAVAWFRPPTSRPLGAGVLSWSGVDGAPGRRDQSGRDPSGREPDRLHGGNGPDCGAS